MFAKLYNSLPQYHTEEMLSAAIKGEPAITRAWMIDGESIIYGRPDGQPGVLICQAIATIEQGQTF